MEPVVSIRNGAVRGVQLGEVLHFRNIPYAQAQRFEPPQPVQAWQGVRDGTQHGPICPQLESPLAAVMGEPSAAEQNEACLTLSVSAPAGEARARPVMVWFHGGAYLVGASSLEWYRPDALVCEGDVVVVNVNYRLGVLGYLLMPGVSPGNLGMLDQIAALRWVQDNIAAFGGDPTRVTLFGESAGAHSIVALMSAPASRGLFTRAIAQSPHLGVGFITQALATRVARTLQQALNGSDPRTASIEQLLSAQQRMLIKLAGPGGFNAAPVFGPIAGVDPLPQPAQPEPCRAVLHTDVDLLIGSTREEMRAFFETNPRIAALRRVPVIGQWAFVSLISKVTERVFARPAQRLADAQASAGKAAVYLYAFDWSPTDSRFGTCHTIDLPFVFGGDAWHTAPMLGTTPWSEIDQRGRELRRAWTRFAHGGDPNPDSSEVWPRHQPGAVPGRRFFADAKIC